VLPRRNRISRVDPAYPGGTMEQVLAANLDWLVVAVSYAEPPVNRRVLDRLLVLGETAGIPAIVVFNKTDLAAGGTADPFPLYEGIGYQGLRTSAKTGAGCRELRRLVEGRQSLLLGPSGVGKTSLLNAMLPGAGLRTRPVSRATGKGVHTTTRVDLHPLPGGGAILDSPGLRSVQPWGLEETELARCFPELASLPSCQFRDCRHRQEPGCQVRIAVGDGSVDRERYESYLRILETLATRDSWRLSGDSG
jgi:ribosome biogenesis GTPase